MKPTVRVSIGGFAFNLEEDAYNFLNDYLESLKRHFQGNTESGEIVADIESRLSELLQMRTNNTENIVSLEDAEEIIKIMGNPKDFGDVVSESSSDEKFVDMKDEDDSFRKRRLFRDIDNKVIGGVCSGLGHYFRIDAAVIRLIFVGVFLLLFFSMRHVPSCMVTVLIYIVLWIVMPAAKTFNQKLVMAGTNPSIENIEDRSQPATRVYRGGSVGTFFKVMLNVILGVFIVMLSVALIAAIVTFVWLYFDNDLIGAANYLTLVGYNTVYAKISIIFIVLLPIIGLLCLFIKLMKGSSFTTQTLICFIVGAIIWATSFIYLINKGISLVWNLQESEMVEEVLPFNTVTSNTLYVSLGDYYLDAESFPNLSDIFLKGEKISERSVFMVPHVKIKEDSTLTDYKIVVRKWAGGRTDYIAKKNAEQLRLDYVQNDSLFIINPKLYSNENPWRKEAFSITIITPLHKKVVLEDPIGRFPEFIYQSFLYD